jgi:sigma-E factor negative regulatory protein RseA
VLDYDLFCRFSQQYRFHMLDQVVATYRLHTQSKTSSVSDQQRLEDAIRVSRRYWGTPISPQFWQILASYSAFRLNRRGRAVSLLTQGREAWRLYHLISDAMQDTPVLSAGFAARVSEKLAAEPTVVAPNRLEAQPRAWFALPTAAAASLAGLALVGWLAFAPLQQGTPSSAPVAQAPIVSPTAGAKPVIVPLPSSTPDYLLAHQGFSPRVSLQGMAPYARTVSDQVNEGGK